MLDVLNFVLAPFPYARLGEEPCIYISLVKGPRRPTCHPVRTETFKAVFCRGFVDCGYGY